MDHRILGPAGPAVSLLGLGCNNFGRRIDFAAARPVVHRALDLGVTLFDTADTYGDGESEEFLGRLLAPQRNAVTIATKFGMAAAAGSGAAPRYIRIAVEGSLKRLATDRIDLYQLHRPDPATPIADTLGALDALVTAGKVRQYGCSYFTGAQLDAAGAAAAAGKLHPFATCQNEYNLLVRGIERDLVPAMAKPGTGFLPYLPLAGGLLTGKYKRGAPGPKGARLNDASYLRYYLSDANFRTVERLEAFAAAQGKTLLDLAMSWLAARPFVTSIIAGATKAEQVEANLKALGWRLSPAELAEIDRLTLTP